MIESEILGVSCRLLSPLILCKRIRASLSWTYLPDCDHLSPPLTSMESRADLHDWELVLDPDLSDNFKAAFALEDVTEDGAVKPNYFTIGSRGPHSPHPEKESDECVDDSDNPSWVDPDSDSRFLKTSRGQLGFAGSQLQRRNYGVFWSDESSDEQRSLPDSEKVELGSLGDSVMETTSERTAARCESLGGEIEGNEISATRELIPGAGGSIEDGEKRKTVWWNMPVEMLKFCIFRVRPVWSLSIAAAMLSMVGIAVLVRKLYRMKHKSRSIPLRIAIDEKKAYQFAARAARFNEAISVVRRMPIIRPSLSAGGVTQLTDLPLR